ncbi:MAG: hypothetical protein MJY62_01350 [Bacteroidales bacterium]|nr:hypothetical protein [Bacteroidales bacterium]
MVRELISLIVALPGIFLPLSLSAQSPVDLGLSVKWASCNVGASAPEEYGDFFAWGETSPKDIYCWRTYAFCDGGPEKLTKYCTDPAYGTVDGLTRLQCCDDAATVAWGPKWRTPTAAEWEELSTGCSWTWVSPGGGYVVRSKVNGRSIFLPAGGFRLDSDHHYFTSDGLYWSSEIFPDAPYDAWRMYFGSSWRYVRFDQRFYGRLIRPVFDPVKE